MKIFNPDGSETEKSGNGLRIFAQYLWDENYVKSENLEIFVKGQKVSVEIVDKSINLLNVNLGKFSFKSTSEIHATPNFQNIATQSQDISIGRVSLFKCLPWMLLAHSHGKGAPITDSMICVWARSNLISYRTSKR